MSVTLDDVHRIAALARLSVSDERAAALVGELNVILEHMDVLSNVPTPGDPHESVSHGAPLSPDAGPPIPLAHPRESFAPNMSEGFFLVPRLATHEDTETS